MPPEPQSGQTWKPRFNPWVIAITVTLATFMEVLDTSIANVALPHIAGSMGASQEEATWVLTSYLVSNAIVLPASAYFSNLFGRKKFYMTCVALFGISSLLCGIAPTLPLLLFFRVLQGIGGGGLAPSEQAILADTFEPKKRGQAFALYGLAVVFAPAIGPTLGGWITDNFDWRWIFFINVPIAILSMYLTHKVVEDPPHVRKEVEETKKKGFKLDYIGFGLIALAFGTLEVILDKGQEDDWFGSTWITVFFVICVVGMISLIAWELWQIHRKKAPILDLTLFKNRTFGLSFAMMFVLGVALYGTTVLIPQLLQSLMGYTAESAGMALSLGGIVTIICMPVVGILIGKFDARYLLAIGFLIMGFSLIHMHGLDLTMSFSYASSLRAFQAASLGFLFVPLNTMSYTDVPPGKNNDVSGLINLARNIGGSAGTAFVTTMLARQSQRHQNFLVNRVFANNPALAEQLRGLTHRFSAAGSSLTTAANQAHLQIYESLQRQAAVLAYLDIIEYLAIGSLLMVPLVFLMKKRKAGGGEVMAH
jgi:MFS transporter, DHA2 family, multidrug resistance protein